MVVAVQTVQGVKTVMKLNENNYVLTTCSHCNSDYVEGYNQYFCTVECRNEFHEHIQGNQNQFFTKIINIG